jgi:hypothetical protein
MARDSQELQRILKASGKATLSLPAVGGREAPQDDEQLAAVSEVAEGQFDVLGEMGRGKKGSVVYLARDLSTERLVALKLFHEGHDEYTLEVVQQLDGTVPALEGACARCGKQQEGWGRYCWNCGADLSGIGGTGASSADLLDAVVEAAGDSLEVLGEMDRAEGGGRVYFARDKSSSRIVALRLQKDKGAPGEDEYVISQTQVLKPLAASVDATVLGPAVPGAPARPARPSPRRRGPSDDTIKRRLEANRNVLAMAGLAAVVAAAAIVVALRGGENGTLANDAVLPVADPVEVIPFARIDSAHVEIRGSNLPDNVRISVDGRALYVGARISVPPGTHEFRIEATGYQSIIDTVQLGDGQLLTYAIPGMQRVTRRTTSQPATTPQRVAPSRPPPQPAQRPAQPAPQPRGPAQCERVYAQNDFAQARLVCAEEASAGSAAASVVMGLMFEQGEGGGQSDGQAADYYVAAAAEGHPVAQLQLGLMYQDGRAFSANPARAAQLFRASAEQGNADAAVQLGFAYQNGLGVQQSDSDARDWFLRGAEQGDMWAQFLLGTLLLQGGVGVSPDPVAAAQWVTRAAEQNLPPAQFQLGVLYRDGIGVEQSNATAISWFERANTPEAQRALRDLRGR